MLRLVAIRGAVIEERGSISFYHKKCDACGWVDGSMEGFHHLSNWGTIDCGSFICPDCKNRIDVEIGTEEYNPK